MNNFGVYYVDKNDKIHYICSCGESFICDESMENYNYICKCGNKDFKQVANNYNGGSVSFNRITVENESNSGFSIIKYKIKGTYNKQTGTISNLHINMKPLVVDFKHNIFTINNREITFDKLRNYFKGICDSEIITLFTNQYNVKLINVIKKYVSDHYGGWYGNRIIIIPGINHNKRYQKNRMIDYIIYLLIQHSDLQILNNANYNDSILMSQLHTKKSIENKPHKIIGLPKYICNLLRLYNYECDPTYFNNIKENIIKLHNNLGADNVKYIIIQILEECTNKYFESFFNSYHSPYEEFIFLVKEHRYKPKSLSKYLFRDIKLEQGIINPIDGLTLLKDYINMSKTMQYKYEKYPKSLKKTHDVMSMNYNMALDTKQKELFNNVVTDKNYQKLKYNDKKYSIVIPKTPEQIVREGKDLSHCVASYVKDVIHNKCKILFMRYSNNKNEALITIEERNSSIRQIRGFGNRDPNQEEKTFIKKWANIKQLQYANYY